MPLYIPLDAVFEKDGRTLVYRLVGGQPEEREVKLGQKNEDFVIVEEGLAPNDRVTLRDPAPSSRRQRPHGRSRRLARTPSALMDLRETASLSLVGLLSHKLRTLLTMLGIIFGVAAVIAMLSIGEGAKQESLEQIRQMGISNIIVQHWQKEADEETEAADIDHNRSPGLTWDDARSIARICLLADYVTPPARTQGQRPKPKTTLSAPWWSALLLTI